MDRIVEVHRGLLLIRGNAQRLEREKQAYGIRHSKRKHADLEVKRTSITRSMSLQYDRVCDTAKKRDRYLDQPPAVSMDIYRPIVTAWSPVTEAVHLALSKSFQNVRCCCLHLGPHIIHFKP